MLLNIDLVVVAGIWKSFTLFYTSNIFITFIYCLCVNHGAEEVTLLPQLNSCPSVLLNYLPGPYSTLLYICLAFCNKNYIFKQRKSSVIKKITESNLCIAY